MFGCLWRFLRTPGSMLKWWDSVLELPLPVLSEQRTETTRRGKDWLRCWLVVSEDLAPGCLATWVKADPVVAVELEENILHFTVDGGSQERARSSNPKRRLARWLLV